MNDISNIKFEGPVTNPEIEKNKFEVRVEDKGIFEKIVNFFMKLFRISRKNK